MSFKISMRKTASGVPVVGVAGDLSGDNVGKLAARLEKMRKTHSPVVAIDLQETAFIDSHGLGVFVYCWRLLENEHRQLVFINPQGFILNMFRSTNLDRVFRVVNSLEEL